MPPLPSQVAFSARPPLASDEAWTTNRHIYLKDLPAPIDPQAAADWVAPEFDEGLGLCISADNPGYDIHPVFSPSGDELAPGRPARLSKRGGAIAELGRPRWL